ncbi:hypothetical protein [Maricaulis sp. CAU 1757]
MLAKTLVIAGLASAGLGAPLFVPVVSGQPVTLATGPVELTFTARQGPQLQIDPHCYRTDCPVAELRVGPDTNPLWSVYF